MEDVWVEESLVVSEESVDQSVKSNRHRAQSEADARSEIETTSRCILRIDRPRWAEVDPKQLLKSGPGARYLLIRLGFQFDLAPEAREKGAHVASARCEARLWPEHEGQPQPTVVDLIPRDLYEGEPRKITLKLSPSLSVGEAVEASLGEVSTDVTVGTVEPSVIGWPGAGERMPYWELRPVTKLLLGTRHLWLIVEVPAGATGVRLAAQASATIETRLFGLISVGSKSTEWSRRTTTVITVDAASPLAT
jgi:hypothetical protein